MKIELLRTKVLIEPIKVEDKSESGLILSIGNATNLPKLGKIVNIGKDITESIYVGDTVMYEPFIDNDRIKIDGKDFILGEAQHIIGIVKE